LCERLTGIERWSELGRRPPVTCGRRGDHLPLEVAADVAIITRAPQVELLQRTLPLLICARSRPVPTNPQNGF
jgi:hypothetical protein